MSQPDHTPSAAPVEEFLHIAARTAHEDDEGEWGYDAQGIHIYDPANADDCRYCKALAALGVEAEDA